MDPTTRGPEDHGHGDAGTARPGGADSGPGQPARQRPPRDALTPELGHHAPAQARTTELVCGGYLLTVNPVDGSEIEQCPPTRSAGLPEKLTPVERAEPSRAAGPPAPPGPPGPELPLTGRRDERERLARLVAQGRSVRLTGPAGSGRSRLLDLVARDCAGLAPDGVVRLSGFHRTADDLLHDLFHAVYRAPGQRLDHDDLLARVAGIGAVVIIDDLEFGGTALDAFLAATPECAVLYAAGPEVPAPSADGAVEEVVLSGLDRAGSLKLLEHAVGRTLSDEEANWAGDLWFESEGLPLRFVQAGALLRQRDRLRAGADALDEYGVFEPDVPVEDAPLDPEEPAGEEIPLPSLAEGAAPAALLASRLSSSARATLRFAVALGGEVPHQAHLPALVGDTHADAALGELLGCALVSPVGGRYRLAAQVSEQLEAAGYADEAGARALDAVLHYTWWAGHASVTPDRVCAEADAVLAALSALVPATTVPPEGEESPAVRLARAAAPAFAAGRDWSAWERALRSGAEAARLAGDVPEQAYFHHELGVLALCGGQFDRARAELEASIGLRGAVADKHGTVSGRRALALVDDRCGTTPGLPALPPAGEPSGLSFDKPSPAALAAPVPRPALPPAGPEDPAGPGYGGTTGSGLRRLARRNLAAAGAGALLVVVLGTVVTLGATSDQGDGDPSTRVGVTPTAGQDAGPGYHDDDDDHGDPDDEAAPAAGTDTGKATSRPTGTGSAGPSAAPAPAAPAPGGGTPAVPAGSRPTTGTPTPTPSGSPSHRPTGSPTPTPTPTPSTTDPTPTPTASPTGSPEPTGTGTSTGSPDTSESAGGSPPAPVTASESGTGTGGPAGTGGATRSGTPDLI